MVTAISAGNRRAFTLIELIFALVIIGLVVITIPMILISNARHVERNLVQEGVLMATAKMGQDMSFRWDEHSWDENGTLHKTEAVSVAAGNPQLNRVRFNQLYTSTDTNFTDFRIGHFLEPLHRRMTPSSVSGIRAASAIGADTPPATGDYDDIDDIVGHPSPIDIAVLIGTSLYGQGYKTDYNITGSVEYVNDDPSNAGEYNASTITYTFPTAVGATNAGNSTNIKRVEIRVDASSTPEDPDVVLRAYTCNIGETDYYKRTY